MHTASSATDPAGHPDGPDTTGVPDYVHLAWHGDDSRRRGPQRSLEMRAIAAAGVELADEGGLSRVTMRTVGARLGMTGMGLYRYVRAKDELLALMIDEAIGPPDFPAYGPAGWRDRLTAWAYAARSRFEAHPWVLGVSLPDPPALPNQTQWTERGLDALQPTRLPETEKLSALLLVNVYVRGQTQLATGLARRVQPGDNPGPQYAGLLLRLADPERFPRLVAAMTQHAQAPPADFADDEFQFGLSTVLAGIACRMTPALRHGSRVGRNETRLIREDYGLDSVAEAQLHQHAAHVRLDRILLDDQVAGDLHVRQTARYQPEHVDLARGQRRQRRRDTVGSCGLRRQREPGDEPPGDDRVDERVPGRHAAHRDDQLLGRGVLEQEPADPRAKRLVDVLVGVERGQDLHPGRRRVGDDLASGPQPVEDGHPDVEQDDRGRVPAHEGASSATARLPLVSGYA